MMTRRATNDLFRRPIKPVAPPVAPEGQESAAHKSQHWNNPETGQAECECCCGWALDYERLRLAFEGYIRDRHHRVEMNDADVKAEIAEWMAVAEDVEDVK